MVTSHAVEVPMTMVPTATPTISQSVFPTYTGSTVETRWLQMPSEGPSAVRRTEQTGIATNIPIVAAMTVQASSAKRHRLEPGEQSVVFLDGDVQRSTTADAPFPVFGLTAAVSD